MIVDDLKKCELYPNWYEQVQDCRTWCGWIWASAEELNEEMEAAERRKKNELKQRRVATSQEQTWSGWGCSEHGCCFVGWNRAGLVNHVRQKHSSVVQHQQSCPSLLKPLHKQGFTMHERFCKNRSTRGAT